MTMPTTSLKLSDDLKAKAAAAARRQGVTPHAFMVEASAAEQRARFVAEAQAARKAALKSGEGYAADAVHAYMRARAAGKPARPPKAVPWRG